MIAAGFIFICCAAMFGFGVYGETKNRRPCPHKHPVCGDKPCFIYPDRGEP